MKEMETKKYTDALTNHPEFLVISLVAKELKARAFVIGGFVRDYFLGIPNDDIDIVVEGSGIEFARKFAEHVRGELTVYENFGTAMVHYGDQKVEFVGARKEHYERGSRKPYCENGTLHDDQLRRDFTINAMAFDLNEVSLWARLVESVTWRKASYAPPLTRTRRSLTTRSGCSGRFGSVAN